MKILGISCFFHDAAAVLMIDGVVVAAAEEERFSRQKHDRSLPLQAIDYCLREAGLAANELDWITFYEKPIIKFERLLAQQMQYFPRGYRTFTETAGAWLHRKLHVRRMLRENIHYVGKIAFVPHHVSHAASAYYPSGFEAACVVTLDGVGEWATTALGEAKLGEIHMDREIRFPHSLGLLYSTITAYLGFKVNNSEYKVMGLAAYGNPQTYRDQFETLISVSDDGSFRLNMDYFDFGWAGHMPSRRMAALFGIPQREIETEIEDSHRDIAAGLQARLEEVVFKLLQTVYDTYGHKKLCLAGGVGLNSVMNGKILIKTPFEQVYIPPAPGDSGGAMGAAMQLYYNNLNKLPASITAYLGPSYEDYHIRTALERFELPYRLLQDRTKLIQDVASMLKEQQVIGWFQGRMEWGPRALGNRSILASASTKEMKNILNQKVKKREMFRPFAPVLPVERVADYFETDGYVESLAEHMLLVLPFTKRGRKTAPATVHVDGTGRLQVLRRQANPLYYDLLQEYGKQTGDPILVNTSFNVRGEPIVQSPEDAIRCFLQTEIDALVIGNFIVRKTDVARIV